MKRFQMVLCTLAGAMMLTGAAQALGATETAALTETADYLQQTVPTPQIASVGGEWTVLGLKRAGADVPQAYFAEYLHTAAQTVAAQGGVLSARKYTEYARVTLALTALGADATDCGGYNLTQPLSDTATVSAQGVNGTAWALIALDAVQGDVAARTTYVQQLLAQQLTAGGWSLSGQAPAQVDVTAMALTALAPHAAQTEVAAAIERGVTALSALQDADGGFSAWDVRSSESTAQVLVALDALDLEVTDPRFVKNGQTPLAALLSFRRTPGFAHTADGALDLMASEQALYALAATARQQNGETDLFDFSDVVPSAFADITTSAEREAIEALAAQGIVSGQDGVHFVPDGTMTRAEFATILTRTLSLPQQRETHFADVTADAWYAPYVGAAAAQGIVQGVSADRFAPEDTVSREQAAVMICRAGKIDTFDQTSSPLFADADTVSDWATESVATAVANGWLRPRADKICPQQAITRGEVAGLLYRALTALGKKE